MVLQSQQSHSNDSRTDMFAAGRRLGRRWIGLVLVAAIVVVIGWALWGRGGPPDRAEAGTALDDGSLALSNAGGSDSDGDSDRLSDAGSSNGSESSMLPRGVIPPVTEKLTTTERREDEEKENSTPFVMGEPRVEVPKIDEVTEPKETVTARPQDRPGDIGGDDGRVASLIDGGQAMADANRLLEARDSYNEALLMGTGSDYQVEELRRLLTEINSVLVFGPTVMPNDPWTFTHKVESGHRLSLIARTNLIDTRLIAQMNSIANPDVVRLGQRLKIIRGPFHAEIDKSDFRLDVYLGDSLDDPDRLFVRSFPIGLGELGSTPTGAFKVRSNGKLVDPDWTNPRSGEHFAGGAADNPIGRFWIGIEGTDAQTRLLSGYGLHGTIDDSSIGRLMSMGCVRMFDADIELLYSLLVNGKSVVRIGE